MCVWSVRCIMIMLIDCYRHGSPAPAKARQMPTNTATSGSNPRLSQTAGSAGSIGVAGSNMYGMQRPSSA